MPLLSSSSPSSSGHRRSRAIPLRFSRWNEGEIFDWYNGLSDPKARSIQALQVWKGATGPIPHRFIVLLMSDGLVHRFDRGPARGPDNNLNVMDLLPNREVQSEDSCTLDISLSRLSQNAHCEIELLLNDQADILTVIAACYAIATNDSTLKYSLFRHNCFFYSWTILMVVSRYYLPYEIPHYDSIVRRSQSQLERLTLFIVDETIQLFPKLVIDAVGIFRARADKTSRKGMNVLERVIWALPIGVIGFCYQKIFTVQLLLGLRRQLTESVKAQLLEKANAIYTTATSMQMLRDRVDACLWIDKTKDPVQNALKEEIERIFWGAILDAISSGLGDINPEQFADPDRKFSLSDVWNAALHGGLLGAKAAVQELGDHISHSEAFDRAWFAARGKALAAAQRVAERDCERLNKPKRRDMWAANWKVWDECWAEIHKIAQPRAVEVAEKIVGELTVTGTAIVLEGMEESENKTIRACVEKAANESARSYKPTTYANLQKHMQNVIKDSPLESTVFESMTRIWSIARRYPAVPVVSLDTINEEEIMRPQELVVTAETDQDS